jgi:hypothetical protein
MIETHKPVFGVEYHANCIETDGVGGGADVFLIA